MIYLCKNKKGFLTIQSWIIVATICGIVFSFVVLSFIAQSKMQFRSQCTTETIDLQKKIIKNEKLLFALNPASTVLRYTLKISYAALPFTVGPAYAALVAEIELTKQAQRALDLVQKGIIKAAEIQIAYETARITYDMNRNAYKFRGQFSYYLSALFAAYPEQLPKFAVEPDSPDDVAPNYGLTEDYKAEQTVAFKWQLGFTTNNDHQKFLEETNSFSMSCGATAEKGDQWSVEIRKDRF